jgi:hypothetical protein
MTGRCSRICLIDLNCALEGMYDFRLKIMLEFYNLQILDLRTDTSYLQISSFACVTFNDSVSLYTVIVNDFCHHYCRPAVVNVAEIYRIQGLSYFFVKEVIFYYN